MHVIHEAKEDANIQIYREDDKDKDRRKDHRAKRRQGFDAENSCCIAKVPRYRLSKVNQKI